MVWRLIDAVNNEQEPLRKGVLQVFWMESNPMAAIPWETYRKLRITVTRLLRTSLTKPGWVNIRDAYSEATPEFDTVQEDSFKIGRDIDTAREYVNLEGEFEDLRALGTEAALKAITYEFNLAFIAGPAVNADGSNNPLALTGLTNRIQDVSLGTGLANALVGTSILFGPTATNANLNSVLSNLNTAIYFIDGHNPDWAFCNDSFLLALEAGLRAITLFDYNRDRYDRFVYKYRNVEFYDVGLQVDQATRIIGNAEVLGGNSDNTSVYFGKNGIDTHFGGWEMSPLDVRDLGELQTSANLRTRVDWTLGLGNWHPRALSRVQGIRATT